ncbi:MAG: hypothetical protein E6Q83_13445 [Thiothrix sp.]|nr:MAG: hypothetical protein E6Q83_13445 [Thiothrix sp.]
MPIGLEAQQVRAIFFPKRKQFTFHRINMEYLVPLKALGRETVYSLLDAGLRNNLRSIGAKDEIIFSLRPQLEGVAGRMSLQGQRLARERAVLREQLAKQVQRGFQVYRAEVEADLANLKLAEALALEQRSGYESMTTAEYLLRDAVTTNVKNYRAHFELAWIYLTVLESLAEAEYHFQIAARYALEQGDWLFSQFAKRHLADACYSQAKFSEAVEHSLAVLHDNAAADLEGRYEHIRYLAAAGEVESATQNLSALVSASPVYYVQAQAEPDFRQHTAVRSMLFDLRQKRVDRISHYVHTSWQNHPLARISLPDRIDPEQLFRQTFKQHIKVMAHLPYMTLTTRENQIASLIVDDSQRRVIKELNTRSKSYELASEQKRKKWLWVNKTGAILLHVAAILLLACIFFVAIRYLADLLGVGTVLAGSDAIMKLALIILPLLLGGLLLIGFIPKGARRLFYKQIELDNTAKIISNLNLK